MSNSRMILCVVVLFWVIGLLFLSIDVRAAGSGVRLLDAAELRDLAKGAVPSNCTHKLESAPCTDWQATCEGKTQANCTGQLCPSCSETAENDTKCRDTKPWTVLNCESEDPATGGCGFNKFGIGEPKCEWFQSACKCRGGTQDPEAPCDRLRATFVSPCTIVP